METALDRIIKNYLVYEFQYDKPERENGEGEEKSKIPTRRTINSSDEALLLDEEYVLALHDCLEKKGIMRELQAFLRRKMVLILQDKFPNLAVTLPSDLINPMILRLLQDFLCCRKLLYTFSVFSSEIGMKSNEKVKFGKMACHVAENLLDQLGIPKDCDLSRNILKLYSENEGYSLLECLIHTAAWSSENSLSNLRTEDRFFQNLNSTINVNAKDRKISERLKQIDQHFSSQQKKNSHQSYLGAEERFHNIERTLEKNKNAELQMAIKKFREEELTKIKEELQNKLQFEILAKENELLLNYKEKAICLKESLEREKTAWLAEKIRQQNDLEQQRNTLEAMIDSMEQKQTEFQNSSSNFEAVSEIQENVLQEQESPPPSQIAKPIKIHTSTQAGCPEQLLHFRKQSISQPPSEIKTDDGVMKEAQLRLTVKRLQEETNQLVSEKESAKAEVVKVNYEDGKDNCNTNKLQGLDETSKIVEELRFHHREETDKMAFLQYNLERQAEEIKQLKHQLYLDTQAQQSNASKNLATTTAKISESDNLLNFIAESKKRCEAIEEQAKSVDEKLHEIRTRRSRSVSPVSHRLQSRQSQLIQLPSAPGPFTAMSKMLMEQLPPLHIPLYNPLQSIMISQSTSTPLPARPIILEPDINRPFGSAEQNDILRNEDQMREEQTILEFKRSPEIPKNHNFQQERESINIIADSDSNKNRSKGDKGNELPELKRRIQSKASSSKKPDDLPVTDYRKSNTASEKLERDSPPKNKTLNRNVEKAVKKGALSFEKVTSSDDGDFSHCSSMRDDISVKSNGQKNASSKDDKSLKIQENILSRTVDDIEPAEKLPEVTEKEHALQEKYTKLKVDENFSPTGDEKSLVISAPNNGNDISHGSVETDSEFWKI